MGKRALEAFSVVLARAQTQPRQHSISPLRARRAR